MLLLRKHRFCNALWLTIFCALALYDFICDIETNLRMVRLIMELVGNRSYTLPGAEPDILIWGGPLVGPVLQQGGLSMICVGLSERDLLRL